MLTNYFGVISAKWFSVVTDHYIQWQDGSSLFWFTLMDKEICIVSWSLENSCKDLVLSTKLLIFFGCWPNQISMGNNFRLSLYYFFSFLPKKASKQASNSNSVESFYLKKKFSFTITLFSVMTKIIKIFFKNPLFAK